MTMKNRWSWFYKYLQAIHQNSFRFVISDVFPQAKLTERTLSRDNNFKLDRLNAVYLQPFSRISRTDKSRRQKHSPRHTATRNTTFDPSPNRNWQPDNRRVMNCRWVLSADSPAHRRSFACSERNSRVWSLSHTVRSLLVRGFSLFLHSSKSKVIFTRYRTCGREDVRTTALDIETYERSRKFVGVVQRARRSRRMAKKRREKAESARWFPTKLEAMPSWPERENARWKSEPYIKMENCWR